MVQRVLLGAFQGTYVLRVSRAGFDVTNPALTDNQLVFSSQWTDSANLLLSGTILPSSTNNTVFYGITYNVAPLVLLIGFKNGVYFLPDQFERILGVENNRMVFGFAGAVEGITWSYFVMRNEFNA